MTMMEALDLGIQISALTAEGYERYREHLKEIIAASEETSLHVPDAVMNMIERAKEDLVKIEADMLALKSRFNI